MVHRSGYDKYLKSLYGLQSNIDLALDQLSETFTFWAVGKWKKYRK